ncbi:transcriptional activator of glycolytic enzymes-domain-containing protein [Syncephalastrum racemosum]|uniref:Transcriptional activator of glycolytic enzymes-domain-containing protein n=1 Tax=Syncephalastrum racemosum TaxID=13706 RepID=A0A1X2HG64_SYNRA|nr:transcriptional activator of glycolytic enzymes-domain-containing protein [Syncephalastrum racemosum]
MADRTNALNSQLERVLQKLGDVQREQAQQTEKIDSLTRKVTHLSSQLANLAQVGEWAQVLSTGGTIPVNLSIAGHSNNLDTQVTSAASRISSTASSSHPSRSSGAPAARDRLPSTPRFSTTPVSPSPSASQPESSRPNKRSRYGGAATSSSDQDEDGSGPYTPTYRLSRDVKTVPELWREWHEGLPGRPSVVYMESKGSHWRANDRSYYRRRQAIITVVKKYADTHGLSYDTAVRIAEQRRAKGKYSLDFLAKNSSRMFPSPNEDQYSD